jgi:ABC-type transport system involved in cytochrome bd biosynthesis fused ATPase/permease subunit
MPKSDQELIDLALEIQGIKAKAAALEKKWRKKQTAIIKEMDRRKINAIEMDEVRLSVTTPETVVYDEDKLRRRLGKKFALICKSVVDKTAIAEAVQEGKVKMKDIEKCTEVTTKSSYIVVSGKGAR